MEIGLRLLLAHPCGRPNKTAGDRSRDSLACLTQLLCSRAQILEFDVAKNTKTLENHAKRG